MTIEFVLAHWSAPSIGAYKRLMRDLATHRWVGTLIVLDADEFQDQQVHGYGECRIDGGPWTTVAEVIVLVQASRKGGGA